MGAARSQSSDRWTIAAFFVGAAGYRPLTMWAENNWDLGSPEVLVGVFVILLALQTLVLLVGARLGLSLVPAAASIASSTLALMAWDALPPGPAIVWVSAIGTGSYWAAVRLGGRISSAALIFMVLFAGAPLTEVLLEHVRQSEAFPLVELSPPELATATGYVEDVVVVVVDSYPSLRVAEDWFGHDTSDLRSLLLESGMEVIDNGWSHHTFTGLAIPSLMQLEPVVEAGPTGAWGNLSTVYDIVRGDNYVAGSLQSAGFEYIHIESGWEGGTCGRSVDRCIGSGWINEASWEMLGPTVLDDWLTSTYGHHNLANTRGTADNLAGVASEIDDGDPDYIFAHLLLPHAPIVANADCGLALDPDVDAEFDPLQSGQETMSAYIPQFRCVDRLLSQILDLKADDTAILITGDHGPATQGQLRRPANTWTDSEVAERLGVLLAYTIPAPCEKATLDTNIEAMRSIMSCALGDLSLPSFDEIHLVGSPDPVLVDEDRMSRIKAAIADGTLRPGHT